jgi:hypothetical protein
MRSFLFVIFIFIFLLDSVEIHLSSTIVLHFYHLFIPIISIYLLFKLDKIHSLKSFEWLFLILYYYLAITFLWAGDKSLALKLILLEVMLIITYLYMKLEFEQFSIKDLESFLCKLGKFYIIISFLLYILGLYVYHTSPVAGESLYFGLMQESILPRLRGLTSSPNEYIPFSLFFLVYFIYFKNIKFILLTLATIILSFSTTGLLIAIILLLIYYRDKVTFRGVLFLGLITFIAIMIYYFYIQSNQDIMNMIELRMQRNQSGTGRFDLWVYSLDLINQKIWGYGINQTRILIHDFHALNSAHNNLIEVFLTGGVFGLFIYYY